MVFEIKLKMYFPTVTYPKSSAFAIRRNDENALTLERLAIRSGENTYDFEDMSVRMIIPDEICYRITNAKLKTITNDYRGVIWDAKRSKGDAPSIDDIHAIDELRIEVKDDRESTCAQYGRIERLEIAGKSDDGYMSVHICDDSELEDSVVWVA